VFVLHKLRCVCVTIVDVKKTINITYSARVFVSLVIQHAKAHSPYYIIICGLSGFTVYFHITSLTARFLEKKVIEYKIRFGFLYNFFLKYLSF